MSKQMISAEARFHKQAAKLSKTEGTQFVVYIFDEGYDVYSAEQCRRYAPLVLVEGCYVGGVLVAQQATETAPQEDH